jgi:anaerobic ribonucleoside-triphosphate reductase activating protein
MNYAGIIKNDFAAAPGVSVSFFTQGCPHRCPGCHNPETWDFDGGKEFTPETIQEIVNALTANGIKRNLCIMGGEPLCPENQLLTLLVVNSIKEKLPNVKIYLWTGYTLENLKESNFPKVKSILDNIDALIDGPYVESLRDTTLFLRGSSNQNIYYAPFDF